VRLFGWLRKSDPVLFVVAALLAAALLVLHLQHQALRQADEQRGVILQSVAQHHAGAAARDIQQTFEAPVFDVLSAVNHPLLREGRLDLVAAQYRDGLSRFPQIDRFFIWVTGTDAGAASEVLFFDRGHRGASPGPDRTLGFHRDAPLGRAVFAVADEFATSQRIYAAVERTLSGRRYHVMIRLFWVDASREQYFALLGFLVDLETARAPLFQELYDRRLRPLIQKDGGSPEFTLQVLDEANQVVFGPPNLGSPLSARASFPLRFYPGDAIDGRLAEATPPRMWSVQVAPALEPASPLLATLTREGYWRSAVPVLLIVVALGFMLQSRRRAAELARMQSTFISHVSHQLKTPLSLLSAASESLTLDRVRTPDKLARYLSIMRSETARLSLLVERVLEFSKLEQGRREFEFEAIDLTDLVRETADAFNQTLAHDDFAFTVDVSSTPLWVRADPAAFEQVLVNLLDNAVKYSGGQRAITVRVDSAGAEAFFEVIDRGLGIPAVEIDRIFERFYRGSNCASDRRGFGLGLAIAQEIVRAHAGRIEVESEPGRGTRFRVVLPLAREPREGPRPRLVHRSGVEPLADPAARERAS
jgi:signal transduction histidine kinase